MNERGLALIGSLIIMLLLFVFGGAAMVMSHYGFFTLSSERKYQTAYWAAEHAVTSGINAVNTNQVCNITATSTLLSGATSSFFTVDDLQSKNCFVHATGSFFGAKVVKTTVVPIGGADWGALTLRSGGTLNLGGSSSIANCDSSCRGAAVVSGGAVNGSYSTDTTCKNNNKGIVGDPAISFTTLGDLVQKFFYATSWNDLKSRLAQQYVFDIGSLSMLNPSCTFNCGSAACTYSVPSGCPKVLVTGNSGSVTTLAGSLQDKTIVSNRGVKVTTAMTNVEIFAKDIFFDFGSHDNIQGGVFYAQDTINLDGNANPDLGTAAAPVLMLAGSGLTKSGNGNVTLNGFFFSNGSYLTVNNGNFQVNGAVVNNGTTAAAIQANSGNAGLSFSSSILNTLHGQHSGILKQPNCAADTERVQFIDNTKMSVY